MKKLLQIIFVLFLILTPFKVFAANYDFNIESNMEIKYENKHDYVTVEIEYVREVLNSGYYFPASGEKIFSIPDLTSQSEEQIEVEREFKIDSLTVENSVGTDLDYSVEQKNDRINIVIPNYKETTRNSPYKIYVTYNTHDYVQVVNQNIVIQAPSLPEDTQFEIDHDETGTSTKVEYNLSVLVDNEVANLAKIWPTTFTKEDVDGFDKYIFPSDSRIGQNPYIEFGTSQIFRFELEYKTPQTDTLIPEKYSNLLGSLSTNILELSLPRYFDETGQSVKIESISPTPTKIVRDSEGNIIATFEVKANKESVISIIGYAWVEQPEYENQRNVPNISLEQYEEDVVNDTNLKKYLTETQYWQVNDEYIQQEAQTLKEGKKNLMELIEADYRYINENLEYDQDKAESINDRIGAKQALQGDAAVCMEYADAMITILRAQNIATRAAIGYSNLKEASKTSDSQVRHQWVQVWVPDYGWLSIDPTWESENMDIGPNIHKLLWETFNNDDLSNTKMYSADSLDSIEDIEFNISVYAVEEKDIEDVNILKTYEEILPVEESDNQNSFGDWINKFIKASSIGRALAIITPIFIIIVLLIVLITVVRVLIRKIKNRKKKKS
jgi:transglutaminase-like putative cysteine protease